MTSFVRLVLAGVLLVSGAAHAKLKSKEHTTERGGLKLALTERWKAGEESKWKTNGKVVLLVHGATWSSRCTFDTAPGYSLMDALAEDGWDVWAVDLHGYGASGRTELDWTEAP
jgi:pimeloyl-ACP methyl ester carboxylesterase